MVLVRDKLMDPERRGIVEQLIDHTIERVQKYHFFAKHLEPYVKSQKDFVFGATIGYIDALVTSFYAVLKIELKQKEAEEINKIIIRRLPEINSKVLETLT